MIRSLLSAALVLAALPAVAQQTTPQAVQGGIYHATPPTLNDLQPYTFTLDSSGALRTAGVTAPATPITPTVAGSASSSLVLKASAGSLYGVYATCTAACWLMVFNSTTVPADGATTAGTASGNLQDCVAVNAGGTGGVNYGTGGPPSSYSTGISVAVSSTACATKTASAVGFIHGSVQ